MSDLEDWENFDSEEEKEKEAEKKQATTSKFDDEDKVDTEALAKQKEEERIKAMKIAQENGRVKNKSSKIDYDKAFEERQAKLGGVPVPAKATAEGTKGMSKAAKGMLLEQAAEAQLTDQLFGDAEGESEVKLSLNTEKDYKNYGGKVAKVLYAGSAPYRIEAFFKEACKDMGKSLDSKQIKKIADHMQAIYNEKLKQEKEERDGKNKKKKAPSIKGGGAKGFDNINNNAAMINDVMGDDEYGDYGDETGGFQREEEANYDFM